MMQLMKPASPVEFTMHCMQGKFISRNDPTEIHEEEQVHEHNGGDGESMMEQYLPPVEKSPDIMVQVMQDNQEYMRKERREARARRRRTEGGESSGEGEDEYQEYIPMPDTSKRKRRGMWKFPACSFSDLLHHIPSISFDIIYQHNTFHPSLSPFFFSLFSLPFSYCYTFFFFFNILQDKMRGRRELNYETVR